MSVTMQTVQALVLICCARTQEQRTNCSFGQCGKSDPKSMFRVGPEQDTNEPTKKTSFQVMIPVCMVNGFRNTSSNDRLLNK